MAEIRLRSLVPSIFLPCVTYEVGNGAVVAVLALVALHLGASPAVAGIVVALSGLGQWVGNLPSAILVNRLGDRRAMIISSGVAGLSMAAAFFADTVAVLGALVFVTGMTASTFYLARQSFITLAVPARLRAAAMSAVGGSHRVGLIIGPFIGAAVIGVAGVRGAFLVAVATSLLTVGILVVVPEPPAAAAFAQRPPERASLASVWRDHHRLLLTLGIAIVGISGVRAARVTVLPLWADHIGVSAQATSLIFGLTSAIEAILFYPAGRMMDRFGRLAVALPCLIGLGGSMALLPLASGVASLAVVATFMGLGNGIGSGIVLTLGADVAPQAAPVRFLSQWRVMGDTGNACGPLVVSAVAALAGLAPAVVVAGCIGLLAAVGVARWAPRYSPYATPAMVRAARARAAAAAQAPADHLSGATQVD